MKTIDIAIKDLKQGFRSWVALGFTFGAPILMTAMFYVLFGGLGGGEMSLWHKMLTQPDRQSIHSRQQSQSSSLKIFLMR